MEEPSDSISHKADPVVVIEAVEAASGVVPEVDLEGVIEVALEEEEATEEVVVDSAVEEAAPLLKIKVQL